MSYHIYTTKGVSLSYRSRREADRTYSILTRDLGLLRVTAGGVRKEGSKLRGGLEPFTFGKVSVIRGADSWRITSAAAEFNLAASVERRVLVSFKRVFSLLERLVAGEEDHPELFDLLESAAVFALDTELTEEEAANLEVLLVWRTLYLLGYIAKTDAEEKFYSAPFSQELLSHSSSSKPRMIEKINEGLEASGLL